MTYSLLPPKDTQFQPYLHCPQCSAATVVNHGSKYICLTCRFTVDVAEIEPDPEPKFPLLYAIGLGILLVFVL